MTVPGAACCKNRVAGAFAGLICMARLADGIHRCGGRSLIVQIFGTVARAGLAEVVLMDGTFLRSYLYHTGVTLWGLSIYGVRFRCKGDRAAFGLARECPPQLGMRGPVEARWGRCLRDTAKPCQPALRG